MKNVFLCAVLLTTAQLCAENSWWPFSQKPQNTNINITIDQRQIVSTPNTLVATQVTEELAPEPQKKSRLGSILTVIAASVVCAGTVALKTFEFVIEEQFRYMTP